MHNSLIKRGKVLHKVLCTACHSWKHLFRKGAFQRQGHAAIMVELVSITTITTAVWLTQHSLLWATRPKNLIISDTTTEQPRMPRENLNLPLLSVIQWWTERLQDVPCVKTPSCDSGQRATRIREKGTLLQKWTNKTAPCLRRLRCCRGRDLPPPFPWACCCDLDADH